MYDVEKLVSIVCDYLDAEADYMKYSLEVYRPVKSPTEKGEYMGKTPNLEQARRAADAVGGALYGITSDGRKVLLL